MFTSFRRTFMGLCLEVMQDHYIDNFWNKVEKTENCWIWKGAINPSGHGVIKMYGKNQGAHRVSYMLHFGVIPEGMHICHKCPCGDNPACVNPAHLYLGTPQQNCQDEIRKQTTTHFTSPNASKFYGVRWDNSRKNWISYVYVDKKLKDIGRHSSEVDAARNHDRIMVIRYGKKERLNFPEDYRPELS